MERKLFLAGVDSLFGANFLPLNCLVVIRSPTSWTQAIHVLPYVVKAELAYLNSELSISFKARQFEGSPCAPLSPRQHKRRDERRSHDNGWEYWRAE